MQKHKTLLIKFIGIIVVLAGVLSINAQSFKTIGYFPTYRFQHLEDIELDKLTLLNIAFASPDENGQLYVDQDISTIVQSCHEDSLKVFIALAASNANFSFWEFWLKEENRSSFIHNIINYTSQYNLQGVDVDLEWGHVNDDYSGFVLELKDSLVVHDLLMSAALPGGYRYPQISEDALNAFDWINIMAYDLTGPWDPTNPGPHSPFSFAQYSIDYWYGQGVSEDRLTLGVPFYGYDFTNPNNVFARTYANIVSMNASYAQLDQVGQIFYNGLPTIEAKTIMALEKTGGIMIWEIGQDKFDTLSLLNRISETIESYPVLTKERDKSDIVKIYPNPVESILNIDFRDIKLSIISIHTLKSENVFTEHLADSKTNSIDIAILPPGFYIASIKTQQLNISLKLVKN